MPRYVAQHKLIDVISLPVTQIKSQSVVTDSVYVFNSFSSDEDLAANARNDQMIVVRPKDWPPDPGCQAGGGTATMKIDGTLNISVWSRLWIDQQTYDDSWLTQATLGITPFINAVVKACEQYCPIDANGNYYFIQPMRLIQPGWNFPIKRLGTWGKIDSNWSLVFWMDLS